VVLEKQIHTLNEQVIAQKAATPRSNPVSIPQQIDIQIKGDSHITSHGADIAALNALLVEKDGEIDSLKISHQDQVSRLQNEIATLEQSNQMKDQESHALREEIASLQSQHSTLHSELNTIKEKLAKEENETIAIHLHRDNDSREIDHQIMSERLAKAEAKVAELAQYEDAKSQLDLVTEKLEAAQSKIRCLESTAQAQDDNHLALLKTQDELDQWKSLFSYISNNLTPHGLLQHLRSIENSLSDLQSQVAGQKITGKNDNAEYVSKIENNLRVLEDENLELRKSLKDQENSQADMKEQIEKKFSNLLASLNDQLMDAKEKLGAGHFNEETTKVLHMKRNPYHDLKVEELESQITSLEAENKTLRTRFEALNPDSQIQNVDSELKVAKMEGEVSLLKKKLADVQKGSERLKQVFSRQISMLRESIPKIFGYQLEMVTDPNDKGSKAIFTLYPQGSDPNSKVIFKLLQNGTMNLVENTFSKKFAKEIHMFIDKFNSIPAFIANMTMDNFQKQDA
jgi:mitotic spindle assembly checkpoint protein MAD1